MVLLDGGVIMSNPWFRLYSEFLNDPKVQLMSEANQRRLVMIFCIRCNGCVTLQDKHVTFQLRISDEEWAITKAEFIANGFIDSDNNVLNWDKRQYRSDTSAARVAKHRTLHKNVTVTKCNVTVTPPEQIQNINNINTLLQFLMIFCRNGKQSGRKRKPVILPNVFLVE